MILNDFAYHRGVSDALEKFSAGPPMGAMPGPSAGALGAVPPISLNVPGMPSASAKPAAPNQGLMTTPVLSTGVPGIPTLASMGKTQAQGSVVGAPQVAAPPTPSMAKSANLFSPTKPPRAAKIPGQISTIGSNNTTETAKAVSSSSAAPPATSSSTAAGSSGPSGTGQQLGGIIPSTGTSPAATLANETASNTRNQVVSVSGGGK